jgi:hypothetical protein
MGLLFERQHSEIRFSTCAEYKRLALIRNNSDYTLTKGDGVVWNGGATDMACVMATRSTTASVRARSAGIVYGDDIPPASTGFVLWEGVTSVINVTGSFSNGDWLCLATNTRRGLLTQATSKIGVAFVWAGTAHSGTASPIKGFVVPWRW